MLLRRMVFALFGLLAAGGAAFAQAAPPSVQLQFLSPRDQWFAAAGETPAVRPPDGKIAVLSQFSDPAFSVPDLNQVAVIAPDGSRVPLHVLAGSVRREFGEIIFLRFYFLVDEAQAQTGAPPFLLQWGPGVSGAYDEVAALTADPALRERYRELGWKKNAPGAAGGDSVASIGVIADSMADFYFLWYLLPMALIFILLTIRKIRARHATHSAPA